MGYEVTRFVGEIDEEFLCQICKCVLENPVQIPCEHTFCYECIKRRITIDRSCPVDLIPITINGTVSVFKTPCQAFRNLLYKLNIECDFQSIGCTKVVKLENLLDHKKSCEFNSDAELVCDKGCNLTVTRREYLTNNCSLHLNGEIVKLSNRLSFQRKRFEGLASCLYDRIKKLNDEVNHHSAEKLELENVIKRQQQEITQLMSGHQSTNTPLKWQICHNMIIDDANILKIDDYNSSTFGLVQSYHPLQPTKSNFQIKLLKSTETVQRNLVWIGLTRKGHPIVRNPEEEAIACIWNGRIQVNDECGNNITKWQNGERIKLGLKFPESFASEGNYIATFCLYKNDKLLFERRVTVPLEGFFPTVCIYGRDTRVEYICN